MAFGLTVLYVILTFLSIAQTFPDLADDRIELIVGILGLVAALPALLITRRVRPGKQAALMAAFTAWLLFSTIPHGWFGGVLVSAQGFLQLGIVFFLTAFNVRSVGQLKILRICLLAVTLYLLGNGLYDYFRNADHSPFVLAWGEGEDRIWRLQGLGFLGDPNAFGQFLLAMLPLLFARANKSGRLVWIFFLVPVSASMILGIWCTHSRGALVGLVVLVALILRERFGFISGSLTSALIAILMLYTGYTEGRTQDNRRDIWSDGLGMFKSSPVWGVGFNGFMQNSEQTAHNSFLLCAVELGLIGCFLWMGLLVVSLWQVRRVATAPDSDPELRGWAKAVFFSLVGFLVPAFFLSDTYAATLYLLLGMSAAISGLEMERTGTELLPAGNRWPLKTAMACFASMLLVYVMVRSRSF